jgi:hypothetical protein
LARGADDAGEGLVTDGQGIMVPRESADPK